MSEFKCITIGIAGGSGSGKTTVAQAILGDTDPGAVAYLPHDGYYKNLKDLTGSRRELVNFDHPDSLDTALLIEHLKELKCGRAIEMPVYDFTTHSRTQETRVVDPHPILLVEGILIFADRSLRDLFDIKIFVDTDPDIRFIRRLERDISERGRTLEAVIRQYLTTVRPMHLEFVEPSKRYADVVIPEGGFNRVALDMVIARIQDMLSHIPAP
ncbi:MAG: uridine kinase [Anaerolineales bacterium]|jgi:uridine kinase